MFVEREALGRSLQMAEASLQGSGSGPALFLGRVGRAAIVDSPSDCKPHGGQAHADRPSRKQSLSAEIKGQKSGLGLILYLAACLAVR